LLKPGAVAADASFQSPMPFHAEFDYSYDGVMRSFEHSQQRLGIDKIDILLMHDLGRLTHGPRHAEMFKQAMDGGFRALAELRASGAVAAIGLGVNETEICQQSMAHAEFDLFLLAGRHTLLNQQATEFLADCHNLGIAIIGAGVYNSGILATGVAGPGPHYYDYAPAPPEIIGKVAVLERLCDRYGLPLGATAFQFARRHPAVATLVIGAANPDQVNRAAQFAGQTVQDDFWDELAASGVIVADSWSSAA
jgi:D-threo-aldose 1-dehydrogenase